MNIFDELGTIYSEIDFRYAGIETQANLKGHYKKEKMFSEKRKLNDQAYFLFMFTRLEDRVRDISDLLIDEKKAILAHWKVKRSWEIIKKQNSTYSLDFMQRVGLLTQKGHVDYNLIKQYYDQRNNIGHGGTFSIPISIPTVIADMKRLYKDLKN